MQVVANPKDFLANTPNSVDTRSSQNSSYLTLSLGLLLTLPFVA